MVGSASRGAKRRSCKTDPLRAGGPRQDLCKQKLDPVAHGGYCTGHGQDRNLHHGAREGS